MRGWAGVPLSAPRLGAWEGEGGVSLGKMRGPHLEGTMRGWAVYPRVHRAVTKLGSVGGCTLSQYQGC